jgi:hypothetical protein
MQVLLFGPTLAVPAVASGAARFQSHKDLELAAVKVCLPMLTGSNQQAPAIAYAILVLTL